MPQTFALRHVPFEDLGLLEPLLGERGHGIRYVEVPTADLGALDESAPDLLVVLGGPIGVYEEADYPFLRAELALIERRLAANRPTLGICLGAHPKFECIIYMCRVGNLSCYWQTRLTLHFAQPA